MNDKNKNCVVISTYSYDEEKNKFHHQTALSHYEFDEDSHVYDKLKKIHEKSIS